MLDQRLDDETATDLDDAVSEFAALRATRTVPVRLKIATAEVTGHVHSDTANPLLTQAEERNLRRDGRRASFEGRLIRVCPYGPDDERRRDAWLAGYYDAP